MPTNASVEQAIAYDGYPVRDDRYETVFSDETPFPTPQERRKTPRQTVSQQQELIIMMLQRMQKSDAEHHATAATRTDLATEGALGRRHAEEQAAKMQKTIEQLRDYIDSHSAKRRLTIYSTVLLSAACLLLLANMLNGPLTIRSPIPELGVVVAAGFMLMARFAPKYKR